jgi:PmbA protein
MVGKEKLLKLMQDGLSSAKAKQVEISAIAKRLRVARFANSLVHQPMEERDTIFFVRVIHNGKLGYSSTNGLNPEDLALAVRHAEEKASLPQATPFLESFAPKLSIPKTDGFSQNTWESGTDYLVDQVKLLFDKGKGTGVSFAGVFWSLAGELAVVNSNGVELYHPFTSANCQTVATKGDLSGFAAQASSDVTKISSEKVAEEALHRALRFSEARELPPGDYPCLLEEYAVADLLLFLAFMAFTAEAVEEGRSILAFKKGEKVADSCVNIWDDGLNPNTFQLPFDVEGVPRKKVHFIQDGKGGDVVHDLFTAHQFKTESTGHALPFHFSEGPFPLHLEIGAGSDSKESLLSKMKRGLLVTRFHYIREVHPLKTMVTGMTRDGLFLVENGEVVARVKNLRFTESILKAFSHVAGLSKEKKLVTSGEADMGIPSGYLVPKIFVESFSFTGATKF